MIVKQLLVLLFVVGLGANVDAANLYVNNSGSPACSNSTAKASNSAASPWCSIGRAAWGNAARASADASQAAAAGDTVFVTAGTYSEAGQVSNQNGAFNPVNSGTAGNLITFQAVGTVNLQLSSGTGVTVGCYLVNYIKWDGFTINEQFAVPVSDSGPVMMAGATGCRVEHLTVIGYLYGHNYGDNHVGIRALGCDSCYIGNNTVSHIYTCPSPATCTAGGDPVNGANGAGIQTYQSENIIIEHNDITDSGAGVFLKGTIPAGGARPLNAIVRFNRIHDNAFGGVVFGAAENCQVYQNLIYGIPDASAMRFWSLGSTEFPVNCDVHNNTIASVSRGLLVTGLSHSSMLFQNNLVVTTVTGVFHSFGDASIGDVTSDRNHVHAFTLFSQLSGVNRTLAQWQSTFSLDLNTVSSNPLFADSAGNDYRLCTGSGVPHASCSGASPALTTGRAVNDIGGSTGSIVPAGAYITNLEQIGLESSVSTSPGRFRLTLLKH